MYSFTFSALICYNYLPPCNLIRKQEMPIHLDFFTLPFENPLFFFFRFFFSLESNSHHPQTHGFSGITISYSPKRRLFQYQICVYNSICGLHYPLDHSVQNSHLLCKSVHEEYRKSNIACTAACSQQQQQQQHGSHYCCRCQYLHIRNIQRRQMGA